MDDTLPPLLPAEAARLAILHQLADRHLTQAAAADLLGITTRQVKRLLAAYRIIGAASVISKKRVSPAIVGSTLMSKPRRSPWVARATPTSGQPLHTKS